MIDALVGRLVELQQVVVVLQERLALDSRNSSKPPSYDGPVGASERMGAAAIASEEHRRVTPERFVLCCRSPKFSAYRIVCRRGCAAVAAR